MSPYYSDHNSRLHHSSSYKSHHIHEDHYHYHNHNHNENDDGLLYLEDPPTLSFGSGPNSHLSQDFLLSSMTVATPQHYLTIEELRLARNSCWLCGCNWQQDHVSLDCPECGGYALSRPCPNCDGKCEQVWKRNINTTHDSHKASWTGQCSILHSSGPTSNGLLKVSKNININNTTTTTEKQSLSSAAQMHENSHSNINDNNIKRDKTTSFVFDQLHANDSNNHYDHSAKTFPSLGQRALTKNLCPA